MNVLTVSGTIRRKIRTLRSDPIGSIKAKSETLTRLVLSIWAEKRLKQESVLDTITEFVLARPKTSIPPDFPDLWYLYQTVRKRKPRTILEFGSGCSTAVLAKAVIDNGQGYLISVDAEPHWAESTAKALPSSVRGVYEVIYSPVVEVEYQGTPGFRHAKIPNVAPNYLYLDGPPLTPERQVAIDVLEMEHHLPSDFFMVVDGRRQNTEFLRKHLKRSYSFKRRRAFNNSVFVLTT
jgi:hypothetical protein